MVKHKATILGLIIVGLTLFLTGCGGGGKPAEEPAVTFMYWVESPGQASEYMTWLTEYREVNGLEIKETTAPYGSGYDQKLVILVGAQKAPDLFLLRPDQMSVLIEKEGLMPLDERLSAEGMALPDRGRYPHAYGPDGNVYGIPVRQDAVYVIFAKTEEADQAWKLLKFLLKKAGVS